jgi:hypothetical protein
VLSLIGSLDKNSIELKNKKTGKNAGLSIKAPPVGLEPTTL